jgi:hypothetical protein
LFKKEDLLPLDILADYESSEMTSSKADSTSEEEYFISPKRTSDAQFEYFPFKKRDLYPNVSLFDEKKEQM